MVGVVAGHGAQKSYYKGVVLVAVAAVLVVPVVLVAALCRTGCSSTSREVPAVLL